MIGNVPRLTINQLLFLQTNMQELASIALGAARLPVVVLADVRHCDVRPALPQYLQSIKGFSAASNFGEFVILDPTSFQG